MSRTARRRRAGVALGPALLGPALLGVVAGVWLLNERLFVRPHNDSPARVDAIVVYAGGRGERLEHALALMEAGTAPLLVLNPGVDDWPGGEGTRALCAETPPRRALLCTTVAPGSTRNESVRFAAIAEERELETLLLVTSRVHATRAAIWLRRCFAGRVLVSGAEAPARPRAYLHEWAGVVHALVAGGCRGRGGPVVTRR